MNNIASQARAPRNKGISLGHTDTQKTIKENIEEECNLINRIIPNPSECIRAGRISILPSRPVHTEMNSDKYSNL